LEENLIAVKKSKQEFPLAALIGPKKKIDKRWPGLWDRLQKQLCNIHNTKEGEQSVVFWGVRCFLKPDAKYQRQVMQVARDMPVDALLTSEK
jgi:hypothetical protein